jgi:FkbM family methyltransferase
MKRVKYGFLPDPITVRFSTYALSGTNKTELKNLIHDIFVTQIYKIDLGTTAPVIIDGGAHLGTAALYFKSRYKNATITCVEPHPETAKLLAHNLHQNRLDNISTITAALAKEVGERPFYFDETPDRWYSTAGFIAKSWNHTQHSQKSVVPTIPLASLITGPINLLKLDIEGAEEEVIAAARQKLPLIRHAIIECHTKTAPTRLTQLLKPTHHTTITYPDPKLPIISAALR